jgi:CBS domain-containing protein
MKARDIMVRDVPVISTRTTLIDAVRIFKNNHFDEAYLNAAPGLVVINERGAVAGILSPLTVMKALLDVAQGKERPAEPDQAFYSSLCHEIKDCQVEDVMDWQAISVTEDALLIDVAELFVKHRFQRIPVVSGNKVVGIIFRSRLLFAMASCLLEE